MTCTEDCTCSLCRELRGYKLKVKPASKTDRSSGCPEGTSAGGKPSPPGSKYCKNSKLNRNDNFILKRRLSSDCNKDGRHGASATPLAGASTTEINYEFPEQAAITSRQLNRMKKAQSYNEISCFAKINKNRYSGGVIEPKMIKSTTNLTEEDDYFSYLPPSPPPSISASAQNIKNKIEKQKDHKVIIYFGDSIAHKKSEKPKPPPTTPPPPKVTELNVFHAQRLCEETAEMHFKRQNSIVIKPKRKDTSEQTKPGKEFMQQLKSVLEEKNKTSGPPGAPTADPMGPGCSATVVITQKKASPAHPEPHRPPTIVAEQPQQPKHTQVVEIGRVDRTVATEDGEKSLPSFVESVVNGIINIKIEESFKVATDIVHAVFQNDPGEEGYGCNDDEVGDPFDWSFVQNWRAR